MNATIKYLKVILQKILAVFDLKFTRKSSSLPVDLSLLKYTSILEVIYTNPKKSSIASISLQKIRFFGVQAYIPCKESNNPFIQIINSMLKNEKVDSNKIKNIYNKFVPNSVFELIGFGLINNKYSSSNPSHVILPWSNLSPSETSKVLFSHEVSEAAVYKQNLSILDGTKYFGAISIEKARVEKKRLQEVVSSIQKNGYKKEIEYNVHGVILIKNEDFVFLVSGGQHRVAAAAALKIKEIPVEINPGLVYRREDMQYMPAVINGYYTVEEAERIFDKVFEGQ